MTRYRKQCCTKIVFVILLIAVFPVIFIETILFVVVMGITACVALHYRYRERKYQEQYQKSENFLIDLLRQNACFDRTFGFFVGVVGVIQGIIFGVLQSTTGL